MLPLPRSASWQFEVTDTGFHHSGIDSLVLAVEPTKILNGEWKFPEAQPIS